MEETEVKRIDKEESVKDIDEQILRRLRAGPATVEKIQNSLITVVNRDWLIRRMDKLKEESKVSQTGSMWYLPEIKESTPQPAEEPVKLSELTGPVEPTEHTEEEKNQAFPDTTEESSGDLKDIIMLEIEKWGKLSVKELCTNLKGRATSTNLYNVLYQLEKQHRLIGEKIGRSFYWRVPTEKELQSLPLLAEKSDEEETKPPAPQAAETNVLGRLETIRKYYLPLNEIKKRFPEILGDIKHISLMEILNSPESELLIETEEKNTIIKEN